MEIPADGFVLRPWQPGDESALVRHANDRAVSRNMRDTFPFPYTLVDAMQWLASTQVRIEPTQNFAIVREGEPVGGVGLSPMGDIHRRTSEIGYWVARSHWGRGLATEAVRRVTDYAFSCFDFVRLEAGVFSWNPASARVLEKAGYRLEARLARSVFKEGEILDTLLYARLREPPPGP